MEDLTPPSTVAGPSQFWRVSERRSRKSGSPNIFRDVNLRQLQRLFQRAGDQDAEQRAQLVWGHGDAAELAQALIALRARGRRTRLRVEGARDPQGSKWLQAFGHLRINEASVAAPGDEDTEVEPSPFSRPDPAPGGVPGGQGDKPLAEGHIDSERLQNAPVSSLWSRPGIASQGRERNPERYLHRILH
ncbi:arginine vasopressin-induced protein 1 [Anguilla rostrata]|nr:arginine vasopressin-induced protein 1 [Anguilla anguilla]